MIGSPRIAIIVVGAVLVGLALPGVIGLAVIADDPSSPSSSTTPGEQISGVIAVQDAEHNGELDERRFGHHLDAAANDSERAALVATRTEHLSDRLDGIEAELDTIEGAFADDEIPAGHYQAKVAGIATERAILERSAQRNADVADRLPDVALRQAGIDDDQIAAQRQRAATVGGPHVEETMREIAGDRAGQPPGLDRAPGPPADVPGGPP